MEKIRLKDYLVSVGKMSGKYIKLDDKELRTAEEWEIFIKEKLGE